jgi:hypothetical protein
VFSIASSFTRHFFPNTLFVIIILTHNFPFIWRRRRSNFDLNFQIIHIHTPNYFSFINHH